MQCILRLENRCVDQNEDVKSPHIQFIQLFCRYLENDSVARNHDVKPTHAVVYPITFLTFRI